MYELSPELARELAGIPDYDFGDPPRLRAEARRLLDLAPAVDVTGVEVGERLVDGAAAGEPPVRIRLYRPEGATDAMPGPTPAGMTAGMAAGMTAGMPAGMAGIVHVHGGGFVMGELDSSHATNVRLVRELGVTLASVDYRLAPEHPYPAALRDVSAVLAWMSEHAAELGVDPARIAIHGVSAGAGLAAGATLWARDHGLAMPCFQFLSMPELDDRLETGSMRRFGDTPMWDRGKALISWRAYLGAERHAAGDADAYAAPARAESLAGLPPTYVSVMEFDPLRDEGIAYAVRLLAAGVPTELHLFPGTFHGSVRFARAPVSQREAEEEVRVLRAALAAPPSSAVAGEPAEGRRTAEGPRVTEGESR